jgi:hypothetical protein
MRLLSVYTLCFYFLVGCCLTAAGQQLPMGVPLPPVTEPAPVIPPITVNAQPVSALRVDPLALQREAKELLDLFQSLQPQIQALNRGLLSKDVLDKLKRIEKLAKQLRGEIAPLAK